MKKTVVEQMMTNESYATKGEAERAFEHVFAAVREVVGRGEDVRVMNFGTFKKTFREGRVGRNPSTGEAITIPARDVVTFKPSKAS